MKKDLIRAMALSIALLMLIPLFVACGSPDEPDVTTTEATEPTPEVDPPASKVTVNAENIASVSLLRSDELHSSSTEVDLFKAFMSQLQKRFSAYPKAATDFVMPGKEPEEAELEIVVGVTIREASTALNEKLAAIGTPAYGISVSDGKICVDGTSPYLLYLALDYLLTELVTEDENGKSQISLDVGYEYIKEADANYPPLEEVTASGREWAFYAIDDMATIPAQGNFNVVQGGGTDGKYVYIALINKSSSPQTAIIRKYDMETWEIVATSDVIQSRHTNDITYDSKNNRLVICTCDALDQWRGVVYLNPDTLEATGPELVPIGARGVSYLAETDQYVLAHEYGYAIGNNKFEQVGYVQDQYPYLTTQGFDCDGTYIYDPRWDSTASHQTIVVHKIDGTFIGAIPLYGISGEPESIMCLDDGTFLMNCGGSNTIYRLALMYNGWWE